MKHALTAMLLALLCACQPADEAKPPESAAQPAASDSIGATAPGEQVPDNGPSNRLARVLDAQPEEVKARFSERNPRETLLFFGIEPGMTVVEALPGGGWYTRILLPYLGDQGRLIGANYALDMWARFPFATEDFMAEMRRWRVQFPERASRWCENDCAEVSAFWLGSMPEELAGTADAVLLVRALHNLARLEGQDSYMETALADLYRALKPNGILGVVQHEARAEMPDEWADGSNGYLKKQFVIDRIEAAGFEFVDESDINANPNDQPGVDDDVWRLPPTLRIEGDDPMLRERYEAIGESNRMTLKFRRPKGT